MAEKMKKCDICGKDHVVGQPCEDCGWDEAKERAQARARAVRAKYDKEANEVKKEKKGFFE